MTTKYSGGCACGAIRYAISAEPIMAGHCQRMTGTGHASMMLFPEAEVRLTGAPKYYDSKTIAAGSLDDPCGFKPQMVVYAASGQPWDRLEPALPSLAGMPPAEQIAGGGVAGRRTAPKKERS